MKLKLLHWISPCLFLKYFEAIGHASVHVASYGRRAQQKRRIRTRTLIIIATRHSEQRAYDEVFIQFWSGARTLRILSGCIEIRIFSDSRFSIVHTITCDDKLRTVNCAQTTRPSPNARLHESRLRLIWGISVFDSPRKSGEVEESVGNKIGLIVYFDAKWVVFILPVFNSTRK